MTTRLVDVKFNSDTQRYSIDVAFQLSGKEKKVHSIQSTQNIYKNPDDAFSVADESFLDTGVPCTGICVVNSILIDELISQKLLVHRPSKYENYQKFWEQYFAVSEYLVISSGSNTIITVNSIDIDISHHSEMFFINEKVWNRKFADSDPIFGRRNYRCILGAALAKQFRLLPCSVQDQDLQNVPICQFALDRNGKVPYTPSLTIIGRWLEKTFKHMDPSALTIDSGVYENMIPEIMGKLFEEYKDDQIAFRNKKSKCTSLEVECIVVDEIGYEYYDIQKFYFHSAKEFLLAVNKMLRGCNTIFK